MDTEKETYTDSKISKMVTIHQGKENYKKGTSGANILMVAVISRLFR